MAHNKHQKTEMLFMRVSPELKAQFMDLATELDLSASDALRELVKGFVAGTITITPRRTQFNYPT